MSFGSGRLERVDFFTGFSLRRLDWLVFLEGLLEFFPVAGEIFELHSDKIEGMIVSAS